MNSDRARKVSVTFTPQEAAIMARPHRPQAFLVSCIDSRFQPAKALDYGPGIALEHRPIACVIPREEDAETDILSRMAFRRLNGIRTIVMVCHSDCGGIQAALQVSQPGFTAGDDLRTVASVVHRAHPHAAERGRALLAEEEGDLRRAGDRLARELGIASMENLMGYKGRDGHPTVASEVAANDLNVILLYYDLEWRRFDLYDPKGRKWRTAANAAALLRGGI